MIPKDPDYLSEAGPVSRMLSLFVLIPFAFLFSCVALLDVVCTIVLTARGQWDLLAHALAVCLVASFLSLVAWFVAVRILRGTRSANGVTELPAWFIQIVGALMAPGQVYLLWILILNEQWRLARLQMTVVGAVVAMIFLLMLVRQRLRDKPGQGLSEPGPRGG